MIILLVSVGSGSGCRRVFDPKPVSYMEHCIINRVIDDCSQMFLSLTGKKNINGTLI